MIMHSRIKLLERYAIRLFGALCKSLTLIEVLIRMFRKAHESTANFVEFGGWVGEREGT
jgi:hypothetical protein